MNGLPQALLLGGSDDRSASLRPTDPPRHVADARPVPMAGLGTPQPYRRASSWPQRPSPTPAHELPRFALCA